MDIPTGNGQEPFEPWLNGHIASAAFTVAISIILGWAALSDTKKKGQRYRVPAVYRVALATVGPVAVVMMIWMLVRDEFELWFFSFGILFIGGLIHRIIYVLRYEVILEDDLIVIVDTFSIVRVPYSQVTRVDCSDDQIELGTQQGTKCVIRGQLVGYDELCEKLKRKIMKVQRRKDR